MSASEIRPPEKEVRWHYRQVVNWFGPALMRALGGWHVSGREKVPTEGAALLCPNHVSYLDPPLVGVAVQFRRCCYMARANLFRIPVLGWFIRKSYSYPVDRDEGGRQALRIAATLLAAGELVVIFPEGTRSPDGELMEGEPGAVFIASRAKVPIVPVAIWGTNIVLPRHGGGLHRCPVYMKFGEPLHLPEPPEGQRLSKDQIQELTRELMSRIAALQAELKQEIPQKVQERAARLKARCDARHPQDQGTTPPSTTTQ